MGEVRKRKRRKKKSRKLALWITLSILVIIGGGGWGAYHYMTHRDVQAADIGVQDDFFDFSSITDELSDSSSPGQVDPTNQGTATSGGGKDSTTQTATNGATGDSTEGSTEDSKDSNSGSGGSTSSKQAIEGKYASVLKQLQAAALSKLDTLANNAVSDYKRGRSVADISSTYMSAANKLQGAVDSVFSTEVNQMRTELKKAGYSTEAADQAEQDYAAAVSAKKSEMLSKAQELVSK